jgi:hypothetical protein
MLEGFTKPSPKRAADTISSRGSPPFAMAVTGPPVDTHVIRGKVTISDE